VWRSKHVHTVQKSQYNSQKIPPATQRREVPCTEQHWKRVTREVHVKYGTHIYTLRGLHTLHKLFRLYFHSFVVRKRRICLPVCVFLRSYVFLLCASMNVYVFMCVYLCAYVLCVCVCVCVCERERERERMCVSGCLRVPPWCVRVCLCMCGCVCVWKAKHYIYAQLAFMRLKSRCFFVTK